MQTSPGLRVVFAGTPVFAERHLQTLVDSRHQVVAVYTQPDRPAGRGKKITASPVKKLAQAHQFSVYQPNSFKDESEQQTLAALDADIMVVVAYGLILPQAVLDTPKLGCINVHASLLPRWRGAAPIQRAIEAGDSKTGVTIMQMAAGLDTGPMLSKTSCDILDTDTTTTLHDRLAELGCAALIAALDQIQSGNRKTESQNEIETSYAEKILKTEAQINWSLAARDIDRKIRAFNPFPVMFTVLKSKDDKTQNEQRIKILHAKIVANTSTNVPPGTIIDINENANGGIVIACGEQALLLQRIQLPGKAVMSVHEVMLGHRHLFSVGQRFSNIVDLKQ
jgi:methionyl-tRNA formyltransferase